MIAEKRIWLLLSKKENDELSEGEQAELDQLLRDNPSLAAANAVLQEVLNRKITAKEQPVQPGDSWTLIKKRLAETEPAREVPIKHSFSKLFAAASIILIIVAGSIYGYHHFDGRASAEQAAANQVSTPIGSRSSIVLPDGTKVWLNAGSRITYNDFHKSHTREVTLTGEAYFDVVHSDAQPFVVHTASVDIYDLGTIFTVRAYPHDKQVETTLIEGSVEVIHHRNKEKKILLNPNEKLTIYLTHNESSATEDTMRFKIVTPEKNTHGLMAETAWIDNKLVFNKEGFHELAGRMERWYNVQFHFDDSGIATTPFSGTIENETLEQALQAMQFSTPFHYRLQGNEVWISK